MKKYTYTMKETEITAAADKEGLSFEEEISLSKQILAGERAKKQLENAASLQSGERASLENTVLSGDLACERLILANKPRAMKIAAEAYRKNPSGLNELEDYYQTAMKVICVCARTYDWQKGCRFGTYVHNSLKNEMMRENARSGYVMHIPEDKLCRLNALKRRKDTGKLSGMGEKDRLDADKLFAACTPGKSLDEPIPGDDSDTEFGETIADKTAVTAEMVDDELELEENVLRLRKALEVLPENERALLRARNGFDGPRQTLKSLTGTFAQSTSGVQKKEDAAKKHLRQIFESLPEGSPDFLYPPDQRKAAGSFNSEGSPLDMIILHDIDRLFHAELFIEGDRI